MLPIYFNTTLVLFKPNVRVVSGGEYILFQYYTSPIQTKMKMCSVEDECYISILH